MDDCIFCRIAAGTLDAHVVHSDEEFVAFHDITPQAPVHVLVIPRLHYALQRDVPEDVTGRLFGVVAKVAELVGVSESGYRVIVNNGHDAGQSVAHVHVHLLGGGRMAHGMVSLLDRPHEG